MAGVGINPQSVKPTDPIIYPRLKSVLGLVDTCRQQFGKTDSPKNKVFTGPVGVGKHTLIKYYARQTLTQGSEGELRLPVVHFIMPVPCGPEAVLHSLLYALGRRSSFTYKPARLADLAIKWLEQRRTEVIVIEDFQDILSARRKTQLEKTKYYLNQIMKARKVPVLFVHPTIEGSKSLELNDTLAEFDATETVLKPFAWDKSNPGSMEEFAFVVQGFEERLTITLPWTQESKNKLLARIFFATGGVMSLLAKLLRMSAYRIQTEKTNQVSLEILASVFDKQLARQRSLEINPFSPKWREPKNPQDE